MSPVPEYLHDKILAPPDELILCVNYCLKEPEILKYKLDHWVTMKKINYSNIHSFKWLTKLANILSQVQIYGYL